MEKILINDNSIQVATVIDQAEETAGTINSRLIPALEALGIQINDEVLKDCFTGAEQTKKNYFKAVEKDLKATLTPAIAQQMRAAAIKAFDSFESDLLAMRRQAQKWEYLTIEGGKCILTQEQGEKLADLSRIYISDPKEIEAFKLHTQIVEKLNELFKGNIPIKWFNLFPTDGNIICRNDGTDYSKLVH